MPNLRKLPECKRCQFNARSQYLVCAVHPNGCKENQCIDFRLDPRIQIEPSWAPNGYQFYNGELIGPSSHLTHNDRESLLDTHHPLLQDVAQSAIAYLQRLQPFIGTAIAVDGWTTAFRHRDAELKNIDPTVPGGDTL